MIAILNAFDPWGQHLDHRVVLVMTSLRLRMRVIDQSCVPLIPESQPARRKGENARAGVWTSTEPMRNEDEHCEFEISAEQPRMFSVPRWKPLKSRPRSLKNGACISIVPAGSAPTSSRPPHRIRTPVTRSLVFLQPFKSNFIPDPEGTISLLSVRSFATCSSSSSPSVRYIAYTLLGR